MTGEISSKSEQAARDQTEPEQFGIGSVIEILPILPICDNKKIYLTFLHFDR